MEVRPLKQAQQKLFDFYRLFVDHYTLQIEASIWGDEPENRLNIIFPNGSPHYQVTQESWKDRLVYEIRKYEENDGYFFFEVLSKKEYGQYLEKESSGIFDLERIDDYHIYVLFLKTMLLKSFLMMNQFLCIRIHTNDWNNEQTQTAEA